MAFRDITFLQKYRLVIIQRLVAIVFPQVPNAARQALPKAGARHERTLEAVACTRLLGGTP